jgi:hypothetical protein
MNNFKMGDKVRCTKPFCGIKKLVGMEGTIIVIKDGVDGIGVSFKDWTEGHNLDGQIQNNSGRWGNSDSLELIETKDEKLGVGAGKKRGRPAMTDKEKWARKISIALKKSHAQKKALKEASDGVEVKINKVDGANTTA